MVGIFQQEVREKKKGKNHDLTVAEYKVAKEEEKIEKLSTDKIGLETDILVLNHKKSTTQIAEILDNIHPVWMTSEFAASDAVEDNYAVEVVFKKDTTYPYERDSYYFNYYFLGGQVPEFVVEATAYEEE